MSTSSGSYQEPSTSGSYQEPSTSAEEIAARDIRQGLDPIFDSTGSDFLVLRDGPWGEEVTNNVVTAVVWQYTTTPKASLIGPLAQPTEITIDGTSYVVTNEGEDPQVLRFIDWFTAYSVLGLIAASRIPSTSITETDPAAIAAWLAAQQTTS